MSPTTITTPDTAKEKTSPINRLMDEFVKQGKLPKQQQGQVTQFNKNPSRDVYKSEDGRHHYSQGSSTGGLRTQNAQTDGTPLPAQVISQKVRIQTPSASEVSVSDSEPSEGQNYAAPSDVGTEKTEMSERRVCYLPDNAGSGLALEDRLPPVEVSELNSEYKSFSSKPDNNRPQEGSHHRGHGTSKDRDNYRRQRMDRNIQDDLSRKTQASWNIRTIGYLEDAITNQEEVIKYSARLMRKISCELQQKGLDKKLLEKTSSRFEDSTSDFFAIFSSYENTIQVRKLLLRYLLDERQPVGSRSKVLEVLRELAETEKATAIFELLKDIEMRYPAACDFGKENKYYRGIKQDIKDFSLDLNSRGQERKPRNPIRFKLVPIEDELTSLVDLLEARDLQDSSLHKNCQNMLTKIDQIRKINESMKDQMGKIKASGESVTPSYSSYSSHNTNSEVSKNLQKVDSKELGNNDPVSQMLVYLARREESVYGFIVKVTYELLIGSRSNKEVLELETNEFREKLLSPNASECIARYIIERFELNTRESLDGFWQQCDKKMLRLKGSVKTVGNEAEDHMIEALKNCYKMLDRSNNIDSGVEVSDMSSLETRSNLSDSDNGHGVKSASVVTVPNNLNSKQIIKRIIGRVSRYYQEQSIDTANITKILNKVRSVLQDQSDKTLRDYLRTSNQPSAMEFFLKSIGVETCLKTTVGLYSTDENASQVTIKAKEPRRKIVEFGESHTRKYKPSEIGLIRDTQNLSNEDQQTDLDVLSSVGNTRQRDCSLTPRASAVFPSASEDSSVEERKHGSSIVSRSRASSAESYDKRSRSSYYRSRRGHAHKRQATGHVVLVREKRKRLFRFGGFGFYQEPKQPSFEVAVGKVHDQQVIKRLEECARSKPLTQEEVMRQLRDTETSSVQPSNSTQLVRCNSDASERALTRREKENTRDPYYDDYQSFRPSSY